MNFYSYINVFRNRIAFCLSRRKLKAKSDMIYSQGHYDAIEKYTMLNNTLAVRKNVAAT